MFQGLLGPETLYKACFRTTQGKDYVRVSQLPLILLPNVATSLQTQSASFWPKFSVCVAQHVWIACAKAHGLKQLPTINTDDDSPSELLP